MNELIQPQWLTLISQIILGAITVWVATHALEIFSGSNRDLSLEALPACSKLDRLNCRMEEKVRRVTRKLKAWVLALAREARCQDIDDAADLLCSSISSLNTGERVTRLAKKICAADSDKKAAQVLLNWFSAERIQGVADKDIQDLLAGINHDRGEVPDIGAWFEKEGVHPLVIEHIREQAEVGNLTEKSGTSLGGKTFLSREAAEYNWRLSTAASLAPLAGMAPTMSGTMEFLVDYESSIKEGSDLLPLSGLNTALVTTWWGCCLAIFSVILLSYVLKRRIPKAREMVQEIEVPIMAAYGRWRDTLSRANKIGQRGT